MAYQKDSYDMDKIPEYALQPAREDIDTFDPAIYEKLFSEMAPLEQEEAESLIADLEANEELQGAASAGASMEELAAVFGRLVADGLKAEKGPAAKGAGSAEEEGHGAWGGLYSNPCLEEDPALGGAEAAEQAGSRLAVPAGLRPAVRQEEQPKARPAMKPEAKREARPVMKPEENPEAQPVLQPEAQPVSGQLEQDLGAGPDSELVLQPEAQPKARPAMKPEAKREAPPAMRPEENQEAQPVLQPEAQPVSGQLGQDLGAGPDAELVLQPEAQPKAQPVMEPEAKREARPVMKPEEKPEAQPVLQPEAQPISGQPEQDLGAGPDAELVLQPDVRIEDGGSAGPSCRTVPAAGPASAIELDARSEYAPEAQPEMETKPKGKTEPEMETKPKGNAEPEMEARPEADPGPKLDGREEANLEPKLDPVYAPAPVAPSGPGQIEGFEDYSAAEPVAAPIKKPAAPPPAVQPASGAAKIIPVGNAVLSNRLRLTDIRPVPKVRLFIEEDILVPDVKPDLASVLSMEGKARLSEREISPGAQGADSIKLSGELMISTLYLPDRADKEGSIVAIESRIPFKETAAVRCEPYSEMIASAAIESMDYTVVNERKFRVRAAVAIRLKEYRALNLELFEGLKDEEVQMLSEKLRLTDVALRKTESMELSEELPMKDGADSIGKILCYDVNVAENHKQITAEKAVISGTVYVNAMYLAKDEGDYDSEDGPEAPGAQPMLYQGKTEFTQFIKLDDDSLPERGSQNPAGSRVCFRVEKAELLPPRSEDGEASGFQLNMELETTLEVYKDLEKEIVTDVYHHIKEMRYDTQEISVMNLCGNGTAEASAREIINVPEKYGPVDRVVFITGRINDVKTGIEAGKSVTEGAVSLSMICMGGDGEKVPFSIKKDVPFRSAIDVPGIRSDMEADSDALLRELWFDKINNRQIEVNAGILVNTAVSCREKHPLIQNVSFIETPEGDIGSPGIILYITREGDNVWRIAKKYRTTIENIKKINGIDDSGKLKPGTKLLIVK